MIAARGAAAQLCVMQHGRVVLDQAFGCEPDALFWTFSASKPFIALLTHLVAESGAIDLDDPVARYWPAFGAHGKAEVTIRQVLSHRSGLAYAHGPAGDALAMGDWQRSVRYARSVDRVTIRSVPAYQTIVYGFILGEVLRRSTGVPPRDLMATELFEPLGMRDTHLGLTDGQLARGVPVRGSRVRGWYVNRPSIRRAVIPSAGLSTTARDMALFYQAVLDGGAGVWSEATVKESRRQSSGDGETDRTFGSVIRWAQGFQLAGGSMGATASLDTFGHNGSNCCVGWADPARGLVLVYLTDRLVPTPAHLGAVSDAVRVTS